MDTPIPPPPSTPPLQVVPPAAAPAVAEPPRSSLFKQIILGVVVGLAIAGGAYGYFVYLRPTPVDVLAETTKRLAAVTSVAFKGEMTGQVDSVSIPVQPLTGSILSALALDETGSPTSSPRNASYSISLDGAADWSGEPKGHMNIDATISANTMQAVKLKLEARWLKPFIYAQVMSLSGVSIDTSLFTGAWISFDTTALAESQAQDAAAPSPSPTITLQQKDQLIQAFATDGAMTVLTRSSEAVDGVDTYHYLLTVNKSGMRMFLLDAARIMRPDSPVTQQETDTLDKQLADAQFPDSEIWIGASDFLPRKLIISWSFTATADAPANSSGTLTLNFSAYNVPVSVETPAGAKPFQEFIGGLMGPMMPPASTQ